MHLEHVPTAPFAFHTHRVARGPLLVEETHGTDGVRLRLPDRPSYRIGVPGRGSLHTPHRGEELDLGPGDAAILPPSGETTVVTGDRFDLLCLWPPNGSEGQNPEPWGVGRDLTGVDAGGDPGGGVDVARPHGRGETER